MSSAPEDAPTTTTAVAEPEALEAPREDASASVADVPPPPPGARETAATAVWTPVTLGPKTFASGDEIMRYFGKLRNELTLDQNMNEYEQAVTEAVLRYAILATGAARAARSRFGGCHAANINCLIN